MQGGDTSPHAKPAVAALGDRDILDYLTRNPDFFNRNADRLNRLLEGGGGGDARVVDLRSFLVQRLRNEVDRLAGQHRALISAARANQNSINRVHTAALFLLDAPSFHGLIETVTTDLSVLLDLDVAALAVECDGRDLPPVLASGVRLVDAGFVAQCLGSARVLLMGDCEGDPAIYGPGAGLVRSQVLVSLDVSPETPPCLLALGRREPDMFQTGMPTDLITFLARVLERSIRQWLDLPGD